MFPAPFQSTTLRLARAAGAALMVAAVLAVLGWTSGASAKNPALAQQSREDCNRCCEKADLDEYYTEQCKLRCFRNPDYCDADALKAEEKEKPEPKRKKRVQRRPAPRFNWPDQLNLTPGKEWEAAAQILAANGFNTRMRNYEKALRAIEAELQQFARNNPQGGNLPVRRLERILRQYR